MACPEREPAHQVVGLADKYRLTPDDLLTSDLHLVPAAMPVDVGLDGQSARLGWGLVFKEYGSGREADSKYFARVRRLFDEAGVPWQTHAYQAGYGGGTTA